MAGAFIYALILTLACTGLGVVTVHAFRRYRACLRLSTSGVAATGQCTALSWRENLVSVRFAYTLADGTKHQADSFRVSSTSFSPGSTFPIVYDPTSPATAEVTDFLNVATRSHRRVLAWIAPVLAGLAALDAWLTAQVVLALA
ncbi:DUF3592 domain-containing protein [Streptomyces sp. NPDC050528]|uniref:DUF3592 domain-containing protein n=1 Tax=unclassified Streptomyces TaxID=2593676 RepID=UPI00379A47E5